VSFLHEVDPAFAFALILFELPFEEHDFEQYVEVIPKLDQRVAGREGPALIVELAEGYPSPNAVWRKRFVAARANIVSKPLVAIVVHSAAARAAVGLARWLEPPPFEQQVFGTFEAAVTWIEQKRGPTTKVLRRLYAELKGRHGKT
jgi:hypothetical protein